MKSFMGVTKMLSVALLMFAVVGCQDFFNSGSNGLASGSALPFDPLAGSWTIGLANTGFGAPGAGAPDSDAEPQSIDHGLGNIVELLQITFDQTAGTATITSTECDISRTFDLCLDDGCDLGGVAADELGALPSEDDNLIHGEIHGVWGPIESCDSVGLESGTFDASFYLDPDCGSITGLFQSQVSVDVDGEVTVHPRREGTVIGARDTAPAVTPDPYLVNGTWTADLEGGGIANSGENVSVGPIDIYVTAQFDGNGGVNIILDGDTETCFPSLDFNYTFNVEMEDYEKRGSGCVAGSFEIENICDSGDNLSGVVVANIDTESCDYYELDGGFQIMIVGSTGDNPPDFSAFFAGSIQDGMRDRPDEANESTLVGDWQILFDDTENDDSWSETVWFDLNEMLSELSEDPVSCSNMVGFPYAFNSVDADFQYTVSGGWNLVDTCEGDLTDTGTQTLNVHYDSDDDGITGTFSFSESGTDEDGEPWSESGSGTFIGFRSDCQST